MKATGRMVLEKAMVFSTMQMELNMRGTGKTT